MKPSHRNPSLAAALAAGLALACISGCATIPPGEVQHRCEQAAEIGASAETILQTLSLLGVTGEKAQQVLEAVRLGRMVIAANCAIVLRN